MPMVPPFNAQQRTQLSWTICGDFNSNLGILISDYAEAGAHSKIGSYGMDTRNSNGDILLDFLSTNGRFASNTAFKHPGRHRPKWTSTIADSKRAIGSKVTKAVFNQIDYVLCQKIATTILKHTRSYWGTDLNSDHKPIIKRLRMDIPHLMHKLHTKGTGQERTALKSSVKTFRYNSHIRNNCIIHWLNTTWARIQMKYLPTCWIIRRLQQQSRSGSSKEGTADPSHQAVRTTIAA